MKKLKVEKSMYPDEEGTHLVVLYSRSKYGLGYQRLFKGSFKECQKYKKELEENERGIKTEQML